MKRSYVPLLGILVIGTTLSAQVQRAPAPWRGAGPPPCVGPDGAVFQCPPGPATVAIRAGRLFDSKTGRMLTKQIVLVQGDRIAEVGADVRIPSGARVIDLSNATVLPGLIDAHTHMFNQTPPGASKERAILVAIQNLHADLLAGFTSARDMSSHGNGYNDVEIRNAINEGRIDGPRYQVSGRGIVWAGAANAAPDNRLASAVVRTEDEARAAVQEHIKRGVDWIKLFPSGGYSFTPAGEAQYQLTYPLPILQALVDETHHLGHKAACHVFGGEGLKNAIVAGCDTIEHAFGMSQDQANTIVAKKLFYDPTFVRYLEPSIDDTDAKNTGGKYRMISIFEKAVTMAAATAGMKLMVGSGVDGSTYAHGTQALDFEALVKRAGVSTARAIQAATVVNAEALGWSDRVGSIEKGKLADIVAVAGDPLTDIAELQRVKFVMKDGRVVRNDLVGQ